MVNYGMEETSAPVTATPPQSTRPARERPRRQGHLGGYDPHDDHNPYGAGGFSDHSDTE